MKYYIRLEDSSYFLGYSSRGAVERAPSRSWAEGHDELDMAKQTALEPRVKRLGVVIEEVHKGKVVAEYEYREGRWYKSVISESSEAQVR